MQVDQLSDDPLAKRFFEVLIRMVKGSQHQAMAITAEYDLTFTQLRLLHTLDHAGEPRPVSVLGEAVGLSPAATGRAIDALHRAGLVARNEDPVDRRIKQISLSEAGTGAIERITLARFAAVREFVGGLDDDERVALDGAIDTLAALAADHFPSFSFAPPGCTPGAQGTSPSTTQETNP